MSLGKGKSVDRFGKSYHQVVGTDIGFFHTDHGLDDSISHFGSNGCRTTSLGEPRDLNKGHFAELTLDLLIRRNVGCSGWVGVVFVVIVRCDQGWERDEGRQAR